MTDRGKIEGFMKVSASLLREHNEKLFALKTNVPITVDAQAIPAGSYVIVDPKDTIVADNRIMVFDLGEGYILRKVAQRDDLTWLLSLGKGTVPSILDKADAQKVVVGHVSMFLPTP